MRGGINRPLSWIKKSLQVTEVTEVPDRILPDVRPVLDALGWERLQESVCLTLSNAAPANSIFTNPVTDQSMVRYFLKVSGNHFDTGVTHTVWLEKRCLDPVRGASDIGLPLDRRQIVVGEAASMIGHTFVVPGQSLVFRSFAALAVGTIQIHLEFIDIPLGEYIPHI